MFLNGQRAAIGDHPTAADLSKPTAPTAENSSCRAGRVRGRNTFSLTADDGRVGCGAGVRKCRAKDIPCSGYNHEHDRGGVADAVARRRGFIKKTGEDILFPSTKRLCS